MTKLIDVIEKVYSGNWGEDKATPNSSLPVKCVRGADFDSLSREYLEDIPVRFINENNDNILPANTIIIEKISELLNELKELISDKQKYEQNLNCIYSLP